MDAASSAVDPTSATASPTADTPLAMVSLAVDVHPATAWSAVDEAVATLSFAVDAPLATAPSAGDAALARASSAVDAILAKASSPAARGHDPDGIEPGESCVRRDDPPITAAAGDAAAYTDNLPTKNDESRG